MKMRKETTTYNSDRFFVRGGQGGFILKTSEQMNRMTKVE